jgi:hypothetical protein
MQPRRFFLNTATRSFVASPTVGVPATDAAFFDEDVEAVELYFLEPGDSPFAPARFLDYSANTVKLAIGITAPAALQTSWSAASTTITAAITNLTNGGGGANEVQRLTFSGNPPAEGAIFFTLPARTVTVSSVSAGVFTAASHGLLNGQTVALSSFTISGGTFANSTYFVTQRTPNTFRIADAPDGDPIAAAVTSGGGTATLPAISTPLIEPPITAAAIQDAFVSAGVVLDGQPQILASGSYGSGIVLTFTNSQGNINFDNLVVSSTLAAAPALAANLSFNTSEVAALIAAGTTSNLRMEVEVSDGTLRQTYATSASIADDIITSTSPIPAPVGDTVSSLNFDDGSGGTWTVTVDPNGVLTATKQ